MIGRIPLGLLVLCLSACSQDQQPASILAPDGPSLYTYGPDPTTDWPIVINWTSATLAFPSRTSTYPAAARADAAMSYDSHHASIGATLYLRGKTSDTRTYTPMENHTVSFNDNVFSTAFSIMVPSNCGHTLEGEIPFAIWFMGQGGVALERQTKVVRPTSVTQPGCTAEEDRIVSYSGGGGGGDCPECLQEPADGPTWCKVRTKYYIDTGEIISQTILYCW